MALVFEHVALSGTDPAQWVADSLEKAKLAFKARHEQAKGTRYPGRK